MLQKLSIMLLSSAQKITYYMLLKMSKIMPLILVNNVSLLFKLMLESQIAFLHLIGCYIKVFVFNFM